LQWSVPVTSLEKVGVEHILVRQDDPFDYWYTGSTVWSQFVTNGQLYPYLPVTYLFILLALLSTNRVGA
jgi:hypothetical protein